MNFPLEDDLHLFPRLSCYLLFVICYLLSDAFFLKLAISCKTCSFRSLVVLRLVIFFPCLLVFKYPMLARIRFSANRIA